MATNVFDALPVAVQRDIDRAFNHVAPDSGGGFEATQIPLEEVSRALQKLDLPPDDEQVLAVFRNAASGWTAPSSSDAQVTSKGWISRDDWRAVCAVLLEQVGNDDGNDLGSDDQYLEDDEASDDDEDDEEYLEEPTARRRTRGRAAKSSSPSVSPGPSSPRKLTKRQQETTFEAFSLFFPDVSPEDVPKQRIMIKDIQRVAKLLGEKIKADEMIEMLDAFSTMPDKSVGLEDFGRIMVSAKLA
ncbi:hypothetical protein C0992_002018 [Termitomyces sp. T32_za158]|nr:hypothetical protein C0992_002018 [Termitomyces sp. T32_za158]